MKNKKAKVATWIVVLILMIVVVVIGAFAWGTLLGGSPLDIFGGFTPNEVVIEYDGRETLLYPSIVAFHVIRGDDVLALNYKAGKGWYYYLYIDQEKVRWHQLSTYVDKKSKAIGWIPVTRDTDIDDQGRRDAVLIRSLRKDLAEGGLVKIVRYVQGDSLKLKIYIGNAIVKTDPLDYDYKTGILKDMNGLIIKINQISREKENVRINR